MSNLSDASARAYQAAWRLKGGRGSFAEHLARKGFQHRPHPHAVPREPVVYFIGAAGGPVKIGCALNPAERLASIQTGNPLPLSVLATASGGYAAEKAYHRRWGARRLTGEWFARVPEIEAEITRLNEQVRP